MMKISCSDIGRNVLFPGIDQIIVLLALDGRRPHTEQAVFGMQDRLAAGRKVICDFGGQAYAEIDIGPIRNVLGDTGSDLLACQAFETWIHGFSLRMLRPPERIGG